MNDCQLVLNKNTLSFEPKEKIEGKVSWHLESPPQFVELRLFWFTKGFGDQDVRIVEELRLNSKEQVIDVCGDEEFSFNLPDGPYSFSGQLVSLIWAFELLVDGVKETKRVEFIVAPRGEEINLYDVVT